MSDPFADILAWCRLVRALSVAMMLLSIALLAWVICLWRLVRDVRELIDRLKDDK